MILSKQGLLYEISNKEPVDQSGTVFIRRGRVNEGRATQEPRPVVVHHTTQLRPRHIHSARTTDEPVYLPEQQRASNGIASGLGGGGRSHRRSKSR